jgi:hypothetical protein
MNASQNSGNPTLSFSSSFLLFSGPLFVGLTLMCAGRLKKGQNSFKPHSPSARSERRQIPAKEIARVSRHAASVRRWFQGQAGNGL